MGERSKRKPLSAPENPQLLAAIIDNTSALVVVLDRDGRIALFNRACERLTGYRFEELQGTFVWERLLVPEEIDTAKAVFKDLRADSFPYEHENCWLTKDGRRRWIHWSDAALASDQGSVRYVIGTGTDISERRQATAGTLDHEAELRKLSLAVEQGPSTVIITDTAGRIEYVNARFMQLTGYTLDEVRGQNPRILKSGQTGPQEYEGLWRALSSGHEWRGVFHNRKKNGELYWEAAYVGPIRDAEGRVTHFLGIQEDITEYRRLQQRFRSVFESAPNGMVMTDENGRIMSINRQMEVLFGYARDELIGQPIELLVPERVADSHRTHREKFRHESGPRMMGVGRELFAKHRDGSEFPVEIGLSPVETEEGRLVIAAITDITARRRIEREAERRLEELAHVSRVSSISQVASGLAHEINQPLTAIVSYAEACRLMLRAGDTGSELISRSLADIIKQGERASEIINRLREFVRKGEVARTRVDVNVLAEDVLALLRHELAAHGIDVRLALEQRLPAVTANRVQIEQVLFNLVRNAIDAMQTSARRTLGVQTMGLRGEQPAVAVAVSDTGKGLPPEAADHLFDAFFSTKPKGMGLGLSICRTIVEDHGGHISVTTNELGGTTFRFTLPMEETAE